MRVFYRYHADKGITLAEMQRHKSFNGGHCGEGVGENSVDGVCCCESIELLVDYLKSVMPLSEWQKQGGEVIVFEGDYAEEWDCGDGVIAHPGRIVERIDINDIKA